MRFLSVMLLSAALLAGCSEDKPSDSKACETGCVKTLAGKTLRGPAVGPAAEVTFTLPKGVAVGPDGRYFVADAGANQVRVISGETVTALAGTGARGFADGPADKAQFSGAPSLAVGSDGAVYVADQGNHRIRVIKDGQVTTLAGAESGFKDGPAGEAQFNQPTGIAITPDGRILVADFGNNRIRQIAGGQVTTVVGKGTVGPAEGSANMALGRPLETDLTNPIAIALEPDGGMIIVDLGNQRLLRWKGDQVTLIAGLVDPETKLPKAESKDGPLAEAGFAGPSAVAVTAKGIFVSDWWGDRIRLIADGKVTTLVGVPKESSKDERYSEGPMAEVLVKAPFGLAALPDGRLLLADAGNRRVCVINP